MYLTGREKEAFSDPSLCTLSQSNEQLASELDRNRIINFLEQPTIHRKEEHFTLRTQFRETLHSESQENPFPAS